MCSQFFFRQLVMTLKQILTSNLTINAGHLHVSLINFLFVWSNAIRPVFKSANNPVVDAYNG